MDTVMEKIERWKILIEIFTNEDKKVFIKEINGNLHFCKILLKRDNSITIKNFGPEQRADKEEEIYLAQISDLDEYKK